MLYGLRYKRPFSGQIYSYLYRSAVRFAVQLASAPGLEPGHPREDYSRFSKPLPYQLGLCRQMAPCEGFEPPVPKAQQFSRLTLLPAKVTRRKWWSQQDSNSHIPVRGRAVYPLAYATFCCPRRDSNPHVRLKRYAGRLRQGRLVGKERLELSTTAL